MSRLEIDPFLIRWISNWLSGRRQRVVLDGKFSAWTKVKSGVIQGTSLGPLLFSLFVYDLPRCIDPNIFISLYADDSKLLGDASCSRLIQKSLNNLSKWCEENSMMFNVEKCKVLHFGPKNPNHVYYINGISLESVEQLKDLGVIIDRQLKFSPHIGVVCKKANSILGQIRRCFSIRTRTVFMDIYKTFVRSQLEHAVQLWNPSLKKTLRQLKMFKKELFE